MPVIAHAEAAEYEAHGSSFRAYVSPSHGSDQLCAWMLTVPAGLSGTAHRPSRDEVLLGVAGDLTVTVDGKACRLEAGDVVLVPADTDMRVDGGTEAASVWVTTTPGLEAVLADGTRMAPPWAA